MEPGEFVLRNNGTSASSGVYEDVSGGSVDNGSWLGYLSV